MDETLNSPAGRLRLVLANLAVFGIYVLAGKLGLRFAFFHASATAVWPPTGIAIGALLLFGYRLWPAVFAGAFVVNILTMGPVGTCLGIAAGNTLEGLLGAWLTRRYASGLEAFQRPHDMFRFALTAGLGAPVVSALVGVGSLLAGGTAVLQDAPSIALTWWIGNVGGALLVAPLLVIWGRDPRIGWNPRIALEAGAIALLILAAGTAIFWEWISIRVRGLPLAFATLPPLLWAARLGPKAAVAGTALLSAIALIGTLNGWGPFSGATQGEALLLLQAFMAVVSITSLALATSLDERTRAQTALRQINDELERRVADRSAELESSVRELEAFTYTVAHDLRAPLRAMHGFAEILREEAGTVLDGTLRDYLERIAEGARRMDTMIQDLLAYSRLHRDELPDEEVELEAVVNDAVSQLAADLAERKARVEAEPGLPSVRGHRATLVQVVANLISNGVKFVEAGTEPRLRISGDVQGGRAILKVEDNGIGIAPEHQVRIFGVFEKLHRADVYPGTGIGLAIVKRAVERMGGKVGVESRDGQGSTFWFELPAGRRPHNAGPPG